MTRQFSEKEVKGEIARLSEEYDIVRLVDPEECHSFAIGADCSYEYGPSCYLVWRSTNRCRNCTSLRALKTGMELHKTEISTSSRRAPSRSCAPMARRFPVSWS